MNLKKIVTTKKCIVCDNKFFKIYSKYCWCDICSSPTIIHNDQIIKIMISMTEKQRTYIIVLNNELYYYLESNLNSKNIKILDLNNQKLSYKFLNKLKKHLLFI